MANQPTAPTDQPPPNLPNLPKTEEGLVNYLRTFSLWCRNGFRDKLSGTAALPGILVMANDAPAGTTPKVFMIQVNSAGAISATPVGIGGPR